MSVAKPSPAGKPRALRESTTLPAGTHAIQSDVVVFPGATLTIEAGATLQFSRGVGITVLGKLEAVGTTGREITFEGKSWGGITFAGVETQGSRIEHVLFRGGAGRAWSGQFDEEGFPIRDGRAEGAPTGGAIQVHDTKTTEIRLASVVFRENQYAATGGALSVNHSAVRLEHCTFEQNGAGSGGALHASNGMLALQSCEFIANGEEEPTGPGGAVFASNTTGHLKECTFKENRAREGGAIGTFNSALVLEACSFEENEGVIDGGAIESTGRALPQLVRCTFTANTAGEHGGAVYCKAEGVRPLQIEQCKFEANTSGQSGAALYIGSGGQVQLNGCQFTGNRGVEEGCELAGGAIRCTGGGRISITSCRFRGNAATHGGAIACGEETGADFQGESLVTLRSSNLTENRASSVGGAVHLGEGSTLDVSSQCKFTDNEGGRSGGAISVGKNAKALVVATEFRKNRAETGGAISWEGHRGRLDSCLFDGNQATGSGGAISCQTSIHVRACQFRKNLAQGAGGGAVWCAGDTTVIDEGVFEGNRAHGSEGGGAIRCPQPDGDYQTKNRFAGNHPDDVAYDGKRYPAGGNRSAATAAKRCWVVTAYYGYPEHPRVCAIRRMRDDWLDLPLGSLVQGIDDAYQRIGDSRVGTWWASRLHPGRTGWVRFLTRPICALLYGLAALRRPRS